jgi:hypothetical protein
MGWGGGAHGLGYKRRQLQHSKKTAAGVEANRCSPRGNDAARPTPAALPPSLHTTPQQCPCTVDRVQRRTQDVGGGWAGGHTASVTQTHAHHEPARVPVPPACDATAAGGKVAAQHALTFICNGLLRLLLLLGTSPRRSIGWGGGGERGPPLLLARGEGSWGALSLHTAPKLQHRGVTRPLSGGRPRPCPTSSRFGPPRRSCTWVCGGCAATPWPPLWRRR